MKRRATRTTDPRSSDPLDAEIDFTRFGPVRRGAFAGAGERGGPSLLALWEMPELRGDAALVGRGARATDRSVSRPLRLPHATWARLERAARKQHLDVDRAMRAAVLEWLRRAG